MSGWIPSALHGLRWLTGSTPNYNDHAQQPTNESQISDKVTDVLTRLLLESSIEKLFQKLRRDSCFKDTRLKQRKYAHACADWICEETDNGIGKGTLESYNKVELFVIKAVSNECKLKLRETKDGGVKTTVTVEVNRLSDPACERRISSLLNKLSASGFLTGKELLESWSKFSNNVRPEAMRTAQLILYGEYDERIKIKCRTIKTTIAAVLNDKEQGEIVFEVDEINKRTLGRIMLWLLGNEGVSQTTEQAALRRLIQACISALEKRNNICWENTKLSLYGKDDTSFHVVAGKSRDRKHVIGFVDSNSEFQIIERHNSSCLIS
ncbi:uncharacterized protein [Antedon mediterranea]|uniref:uncharacterized protein n=1 Tax=Antedon mediterranea TaxID=105859 RepID=UPI003AF9AF68